MKSQHLGFLAMIIAALGLGIAVILMKSIPVLTGMPPQHIAIWRFALAAPPLWLVLRLRRPSQRMAPAHPWRFIGLGFFLAVASFTAIFALQHLSSSVYVILIYVYPSLVALYTLLSGGAVPRLLWVGLPLTLLGLFLTSFEFGARLMVNPFGVLFTLINALALATYMILSARAFKTADDRLLSTGGVLTGAMLAGLLMLPIFGISAPGTLQGWVLLLSFGIFGTLMPFVAMNIGLGLLGAARGSVIITLQPVLTVLLAMVFLGETLSFQQWIGGGLVVLAIFLLQRSPDRTRTPRTRRRGLRRAQVSEIPPYENLK